MKLKARWLAYLLSAVMAVTLLSGADVTDLDVYAAEEKPDGGEEGTHVQENGPGASEHEKDETLTPDTGTGDTDIEEDDVVDEEDVDEDVVADAEDADGSDDTADSDDDSSEDAEEDEDTEDEDDSESEDETESEEDEDEESDETEETEEESEGDEDTDAAEGGSASGQTLKGITVSVSWEEGTFAVTPDGIAVSDVSDAERTVSDYYEREDKSVEVIDAVGVDISFYVENEDGEKEEIEPLTNEDGSAVSAVSVTISLPSDQELQTTEDAEIAVLHESDADDRGGKTEITELSSVDSADAESVTFEADSFSTYYVVVKNSTSEDNTSKEIIVSQSGIEVPDDSGDYSTPGDLAKVTSSDNLIQEAIDYIYSQEDLTGWTITIESGTYTNFIVPNGMDNLTIEAADDAEVIIQTYIGTTFTGSYTNEFTDSYYYDGIAVSNAANFTLEDVTITVGSTTSTFWAAAVISFANGKTTSQASNGFTLDGVTIEGNGNTYGIFIENYLNEYTITNCTISDCTTGIYNENTTGFYEDIKITNNSFTDCSFAFHGSYSGTSRDDDSTVETNTLVGSFVFTGNTITGSSDLRNKVVIQDANRCSVTKFDISNNTLTSAMIGLVCLNEIEGETNDVLLENTFGENSYYVEAIEPGTVTAYVTYYAPEGATGYWVLTGIDDLEVDWGGNPEGTIKYVQSVIDEANESGSTVLTIITLNNSGDEDDLIRTFTWFKDAIYWVTVNYTTVEVSKKWETNDINMIPGYLTVDLYQVDADGNEILYKTAELNAEDPDNLWSYTFEKLPYSYTDDDGETQLYTYQVRERPVSGWKLSHTSVSYDEDTRTYTIELVNSPEEPGEPNEPENEPSGGGTIGSGGLAIVKIDAETGEYLEGATFALYRTNDDSLVGTYTTDENGWLSVGPLTYETYYFVEIEAPEGYVLDSTPIHVSLTSDLSYSAEYPWVITVKNTKSGIEVTTTTDATDTTTDTTETTSTADTTASGSDATGTTSVTETSTVTATARDAGATGDDSSLMLWIIAMVLSGAGLGAAAFYTRRRRTGR